MVIDLGIYPCKVIVCIEDKQAIKVLEDVVSESELEIFLSDENPGLTFMFSCGDVAIFIKEKPATAYQFSKLAHEIYHCATYVLNYVGVKHSKKSDEAFAYLVGFLTEKIYEPIVDTQ
jgi:hypothetical protein